MRRRTKGKPPGWGAFPDAFPLLWNRDIEPGLDLCLELFEEVAGRAGDVNSAGCAALAVLDPLDDAGGLAALGTIGALGRVHYLLAVCCLGDLSHGNSVSYK